MNQAEYDDAMKNFTETVERWAREGRITPGAIPDGPTMERLIIEDMTNNARRMLRRHDLAEKAGDEFARWVLGGIIALPLILLTIFIRGC